MGDPSLRSDTAPRSRADVQRWRRYLADERAEAAVYRNLASRRTGEEREILVALAEAEGRHEQHWRDLLGDDVGRPLAGSLRTRVLAALAARFGSVFVLALMQRAEDRSPYADDADPTSASTARSSEGSRTAVGCACPGPSARRSSAPTTGWCPTSRSSSA
jgi:hypothetical protein